MGGKKTGQIIGRLSLESDRFTIGPPTHPSDVDSFGVKAISRYQCFHEVTCREEAGDVIGGTRSTLQGWYLKSTITLCYGRFEFMFVSVVFINK